jgi:hypothetical protein
MDKSKALRVPEKARRIGLATLFILLSWAAIFIGAAQATNPPAVPNASAEASAESDSVSASESVSTSSVAVSDDDSRLSLVLGAGGSDVQNYTAPCVAPKRGGFLKRGFSILGIVRVGQAVEVADSCAIEAYMQAEHLRALDLARLELERERVELERLRVELESRALTECLQCEVAK